jgi:hypothetical protein
VLAAAVALFGCGQHASAGGDGGADLRSTLGDAFPFDLAAPATCPSVDPMDDGQPCGMGCPTGLLPVSGADGSCRCYRICDPDRPTTCPCSRRCAPLLSSDGGVAGGACLYANGPGQRCGLDPSGKPYGNAGCPQGLACVNEDAAGLYRYCVYGCAAQNVCPVETSCLPLASGGMALGMACALDSSDTGSRGVGQTCGGVETCRTGSLCDTTCKPQCDGPLAPCASGSCTALVDGTRTVGYVCK